MPRQDPDISASERNRRRFSRVLFNRTARLYLGGRRYEYEKIRNLSIGGVFVEGHYKADPGEICELELHESGRHSSLILRFFARIVRITDNGVALEFIDMGQDAYMFLQTLVLYHSDDPYTIALEFLDGFPAALQENR